MFREYSDMPEWPGERKERQAPKASSDDGINVVAMRIARDDGLADKYVLMFDDSRAQLAEAMRWLGRWASNPQLSFSWYSAAVCSQKIRSLSRDLESKRARSNRDENCGEGSNGK